MAKILLLDYEKEDFELLQERNYDVEFAETNWKSLTTDILIVPKNCRIVFYQLNSENPASGLHSEDTEKFQTIIDQGGVIVCFIGRCKQFQLTNFTGEYPNLDMQNYDIPNPIDSIQEPPFDQIFKEYGQFISYANTLFNVVLPVGETISMAAWDPNLEEKLTVLASGANGLPLSVMIQRENGFFLFLPWFGDHNNTITEMLLDTILPEISPNLFKEEAAPPVPPTPPEETPSETSEEETLPDLSDELESVEIEEAEIDSSEMKPPEDELPEMEETEAPPAEAETAETEVQEKEPEDLQEPKEEKEEEESWEEPEADSVPELPEEPPEAVEEEVIELSEEETLQEDQIEIEEDKLSEDIEIPEAEEEPEKTLEEELEIEEELELEEEAKDITSPDEEEIPSWEEEAEVTGTEKESEAEGEQEQQPSSDEEEYFSELEEATPPEETIEDTKTGVEEQETEEVPAEQEPAPPEEIKEEEPPSEMEEEPEITEAPAEEAEAEVQPEQETEPEIPDESGFEQKSIPDTVLLEEEEKPSEATDEETPSEMEEISPPVESAVEKEEKVSWMEKDEYLFPSVKEISEKLEEERIKYEEKIQKLTDSMKELKEKEQIVFTKLLTAEGEELKQAVISTLEYLGGKKVIDVRELWKDEERGPEEDIWLLKDDKKPVEDKIKKDSVILVTVKSDDKAANDNECSSIQKYKGRRMQEFHNTDMKAILIGNYYRQEEPKLRKDPFSEDQIAEAKIDQNALLTTFELFKAVQAEKTKKISKSDIIKQLETKLGLISFDY